MLKELFESVVSLAKNSLEAKIVKYPNDPNKSFVFSAGQAVAIDTPEQVPDHLDQVLRVVDFAKSLKPGCDVFFDHDTARSYFDGHFRRSGITLPFDRHPELVSVYRMSEPLVLEQRTLVRFLRHDLAECVDPHVLPRFRQINWDVRRKTMSSVQHGASGLDGEVRASIGSTTEVPESFVVRPHLFSIAELADEVAPLTVTVDIDADIQRFTLTLSPGAREAVELHRLNLIERVLTSAIADPDVRVIGCRGPSDE